MSGPASILRQAEQENNDIHRFPDLDEEETIFDRRTVISVQPFSTEEVSRRNPLPLTGGSPSFSYNNLPITGISLLYDIEEISIEQTYELDDLLSVVESEKRYFIKTDGQIIFGGLENSSTLQRLICGSSRRFNFTIYDRTKQEALTFVRRLACSNALLGCFLQRIDVFVPKNEYLGSIEQKWYINKTVFVIWNSASNKIYQVEGPSQCSCSTIKDVDFRVFDQNNDVVSKISYEWDGEILNYKLVVSFPRRAETNQRALLMSCGILLDYMFFEQSTGCKCCFKCR